MHYERVRTYEVVVQTNPTKEVLVTFQEDTEVADDNANEVFDESPRKRLKGVYYKDIHMRTLLRKTRAKVSDPLGSVAKL